jgi:lambda family phage portal protein
MIPHWLDRLTAPFFPRWTLQRQRARVAGEVLARHYEAASAGRRTQGWQRSSGDANTTLLGSLGRLREHARDLVRNNPYATAALDTIVDQTIGWGIVPKPRGGSPAARNRATDRWRAWAETVACDADGRLDFAGLQKLVLRTVVESGEVLIRRRWRRPEDGLPIPLQLQVLEPDFLDTTRDTILPSGGRRIIQGIEFDALGRRVAYWLFREHPGSSVPGAGGFGMADRIPASEILHVFKPARPGQVRGASWFAPVMLRLKEFDEYEDAALMKQKIAACLAVITTDVDGTTPALGATDAQKPEQDLLEPGLILNFPAGRSATVVEPPSVSEHAPYSQTILRAIAAGLGVTYEDLTGDYQGMPFSAARMSRLRHWARVEDWRWRMLIPQFCDPVWGWAMEAAQIIRGVEDVLAAEWTAPPMPMLDPSAEGLALQRLVRIGALSWPEMIRERGYDPEAVLAEIAEWNAKFDAAQVVLDTDPRRTSQAGQLVPPEDVSAGNGNGVRR